MLGPSVGGRLRACSGRKNPRKGPCTNYSPLTESVSALSGADPELPRGVGHQPEVGRHLDVQGIGLRIIRTPGASKK